MRIKGQEISKWKEWVTSKLDSKNDKGESDIEPEMRHLLESFQESLELFEPNSKERQAALSAINQAEYKTAESEDKDGPVVNKITYTDDERYNITRIISAALRSEFNH